MKFSLIKRFDKTDISPFDKHSFISYGLTNTGTPSIWCYCKITFPLILKKTYVDPETFNICYGKTKYSIIFRYRKKSAEYDRIFFHTKGWFPV